MCSSTRSNNKISSPSPFSTLFSVVLTLAAYVELFVDRLSISSHSTYICTHIYIYIYTLHIIYLWLRLSISLYHSLYICIHIFSFLNELVYRKIRKYLVCVSVSRPKAGMKSLYSFFGSGFGLYRIYIIKLNFLVTDFNFNS